LLCTLEVLAFGFGIGYQHDVYCDKDGHQTDAPFKARAGNTWQRKKDMPITLELAAGQQHYFGLALFL
jgi:hypothetical protein